MAAKGGQIWVQDPSTCVVSSMIDGAMEAGIVGFIGTPAALAAEFARRFGKA
jgi:chemotaxis response regulator CheB